MKKILVMLSVLFAATALTSCMRPYEPTISLAINNRVLYLRAIAYAHPDGLPGNYHYIQITSTGSWEATLETEDGTAWCWLNDFYLKVLKDENGVPLKDELGNLVTERVYIAKGVEAIGDSDTNFRKVKGTGTVFLPMMYNNSQGKDRYATFYVRRPDTGELCVMNIKQVK